eukprot:2580762-Pleurochrysis_carterae.AAC.1
MCTTHYARSEQKRMCKRAFTCSLTHSSLPTRPPQLASLPSHVLSYLPTLSTSLPTYPSTYLSRHRPTRPPASAEAGQARGAVGANLRAQPERRPAPLRR